MRQAFLAALMVFGFAQSARAVVSLAIPEGHNYSSSDGVLLYNIDGTGPLTALPSIPGNPTNSLYNPIQAVFSSTGELFVSNRNVTLGVGSVARFVRDTSGTFVSNGLITGNSLDIVSGLAFSPSGELFAANVNNGLISRFLFDGSGNAVPNGTISRPGNNVGLAFSLSGELFAGSYSQIDRYTFDGGGNATANGSFSIPGAVSIHFLAFSAQGELFVANQTLDGFIYRFLFDMSGIPVPNGAIHQPGGAIGVAFSPFGELFATSQTQLSDGGGIYRFLFDQSGNAVPNGHILTDHLGGPAIYSFAPETSPIPEPASVPIWNILGSIGLGARWIQQRHKT